MDKPIQEHIRRKQQAKLLAAFTAAFIVITLAILLLRSWLAPSVSRSRIRTATVETGSIQATVDASGTVQPEFEQVISCPFNTRVVKILKQPGAELTAEETIITLDTGDIELNLARIEDEISLKRNQKKQFQIDLDQNLSDLNSEMEILTVRMALQKAKLANEQEMYGKRMTTIWNLKQAEMEEEIAGIELRQQLQRITQNEKALRTRIEGLDIEMRVLMNARREITTNLGKAKVKSGRSGILTWIVADEGVSLREGDVLARVADLSSWKIIANISDVHASRLSTGMNVIVNVNNQILNGSIYIIHPQINKGNMSFEIKLQDERNQYLRSNQRVDIQVITSEKSNVLLTKNGPFVKGSGDQMVFVVRGNEAWRTEVCLGVTNLKQVEIVSGLRVGEEVIVSEMRDYEHLEKVKVKG